MEMNRPRAILKHEKVFRDVWGVDWLNGKVLVSISGSWEWANWKVLSLYTGLKDKNGREIYKGDILKIHNLDCQLQKATLYGVVVFSNASFGVEIMRVEEWTGYNVEPREMIWFLSMINMMDYEVIGNIYDNPELATT